MDLKNLVSESWEGPMRKSNPDGSLSKVETLAEADCIFFLCPLCFKNNNGPVGTHGILIPSEKMPVDGRITMTNRWVFQGDSVENLTVIPSILIDSGCGAHFHIRDGKIVF